MTHTHTLSLSQRVPQTLCVYVCLYMRVAWETIDIHNFASQGAAHLVLRALFLDGL
jgi:hypothetical protein